MSGIAAVVGSTNDKLVRRMLGKLRHRGPDAEWVYVGRNSVLGCTGSALRGNSSPYLLYDGSAGFCLVADASIYNYQYVRNESSDSRANTNSVVEALLHLYRRHGPSCVEWIDGIFAFAISDNSKLFVARDRLGVKPLYYARKNGNWYFASELKALIGECEGVHEFPSGHYFASESGFRQYFRFEQPASANCRPEKLAEDLKTTLDAAVRKRLPCDDEVGVLLSGGLDSSTVCLLATRYCSGVHSFTAGTEHSEDLGHARALAEKLGTNHHEYVYTINEMLEVLPNVIYHLESFDYPLVRSSVANYLASKMAGEHVKIALCGEGSDELFAGYDHLKKHTPGTRLNSILAEMIFTCHNTGLQRVDRMNMAHGVEARMPYFDLDLLRFAFTVPVCYKVHPDTGTGKWIVRKAFERDLPEGTAWRGKQKFSVGAGSCELMSEIADSRITDTEFQAERRLSNGHVLRNKEELLYYRIYRDFFGDTPAVLNTVGITPIV